MKKVFHVILWSIKAVFGLVAGLVGGIFLFLVISSFITGPPLSVTFQAFMSECIKDEDAEFSKVDFVGHTLHLPTKHILSCHPVDTSSSWDYDPADITLNASLPDFEPLVNKGKTYRDTRHNEIRINFTGMRSDNKFGAGADYDEVDLNQHFDRKRTAINKKTGERFYTGPTQTELGLIKYSTDRYDVYGHKNEDGNIEFILRCALNKEKEHRRYSCNSVEQNIYPNAIYDYSYNLEFLPHAVEIDRKVKQLIEDIVKGPQ